MKVSNTAWNLKDENYGPFLEWIYDDNVTDINYNGKNIWIEDLNKGRYMAMTKDEERNEVPLTLTQEFINQFCTRVANVVSANFNKYSNLLEAETETLRISIIHESVANTGTSISIRKTPAIRRITEESIIETNYCSEEVLNFLKNCVKGKMNMVFCGLPGTGKTELLKFLTQYIPHDEKVMTVEDNLEIHFRAINPDSNCVELKVDDEFFSYTKAIKASLRQNPQWVLLSEARSVEVKYLIEAFSTGLHGLTTLHTDDCRKIPDRIKNMMADSYAASRLENDIFYFVNIAVLIRKKIDENGTVRRYIDQVCLFDRVGEKNIARLIVEDGKIVNKEITKNIRKKFEFENVKNPFDA